MRDEEIMEELDRLDEEAYWEAVSELGNHILERGSNGR